MRLEPSHLKAAEGRDLIPQSELASDLKGATRRPHASKRACELYKTCQFIGLVVVMPYG